MERWNHETRDEVDWTELIKHTKRHSDERGPFEQNKITLHKQKGLHNFLPNIKAKFKLGNDVQWMILPARQF